jgi:hypothetical protein
VILRPGIQSEIADKYVNVTEAIREAQSNRLNGLRRPKALFSGSIHCGVCGGPCSLRGQDRYACSARITNGSCANTRTITRSDLEQRVLAGLNDRMMAPEMAGEAMRAYAAETNRLNRERRASGEGHRAAKSTPPYAANWARSSAGSKHKPLKRLGNAKLPQLSLRECRYRWLRG